MRNLSTNAITQPKMGALSSFGSMKSITNFKQPNIERVSATNYFNNPIPYGD